MDQAKPSADKILIDTVRMALENKKSWALVLFVPALLLLTTDILLIQYDESSLKWPLLFANLACYTVFAVAVHRLYLLEPEQKSSLLWPNWTKRETYFLLCMLGLVVLGSVIFIPILLISFAFQSQFAVIVGQMVGICVAVYFVARCSLVFPATAINHGLTFKDSWKITQDHRLLMVLIAIGIPIAFAVPTVVLQYLPLANWIGPVINLILTVLTIGCLSLTYRQIIGYESDGQQGIQNQRK